MIRTILSEKVCYYDNVIEHFDDFMTCISELETMHKSDGIDFWENWTSSNNLDHIYGETKTFDLSKINQMDDHYKDKMLFIYNVIMSSLVRVSKDYANLVGDKDEPKLFPVFNIKKYDTGLHMGSHFDQLDGDTTLRYSLVMYLNDDYEGGEISFKITDYVDIYKDTSPEPDYETAVKNNKVDFGIKPKANSVIIFPSSAPYYHTAHRVKSGFKYMIPGHWIHNDMNFNIEEQ